MATRKPENNLLTALKEVQRMSLTKEAQYERTWGEFPELANILDVKRPGSEWTGYTSVSDNVFDRFSRLLHMFALIQESEREIHDAFLRLGPPLRQELKEVSRRLRWISEEFERYSRVTSDLANRR